MPHPRGRDQLGTMEGAWSSTPLVAEMVSMLYESSGTAMKYTAELYTHISPPCVGYVVDATHVSGCVRFCHLDM